MQRIYEGMKDLLLSARMALSAVFYCDFEPWDVVWKIHEYSRCTESEMAKWARSLYPDQDEFIRCWAEKGRNRRTLTNPILRPWAVK